MARESAWMWATGLLRKAGPPRQLGAAHGRQESRLPIVRELDDPQLGARPPQPQTQLEPLQPCLPEGGWMSSTATSGRSSTCSARNAFGSPYAPTTKSLGYPHAPFLPGGTRELTGARGEGMGRRVLVPVPAEHPPG